MALSAAIWYFSRPGNVSQILLWILLGVDIILLLAFIIYDYGIQKKKVSKLNRKLIMASLLMTVIFSLLTFCF